MRIGYFVWEYPPRLVGGLGTYAKDVVAAFKKMGHDISLFTLNPGDLKTNEMMNGISVHRPKNVKAYDILPLVLSDDLKKWGGTLDFFNEILSYNFLSASKFVNQVSLEKKYDVVAIHDWLSAISGLMIKDSMKIPVVFHLHSTEVQRSGGGSRTIRDMEMKMMEKADLVITVSYSMRDHLVSLGCPFDKIRVVWNGCDAETYRMEKADKNLMARLKTDYGIGKDRMILFIGRLTGVKGVDNLILSFPSVLREFPDTKLVIIGKGEQYNSLVQMCERLNISHRVKIISNFISEEERIASYALSDVCVFPSTSEPFGIVSLEAMALKKPLVVGASGINGFKEQVIASGPEQCGVHVDGNKPDDIAWGLKEVLRDPARAKKWGENGRKRVENYFNIEKVAKNTLAVYSEAVERR